MKYQTGKPGRIIVAKFDDNDDLLSELSGLAQRESLKSAVFYLIGAMKEGSIVVGPEREELPPAPVWKDLTECHEVLGIGTIFRQGEVPKIHFHGAFGRHNKVTVGCLRDASKTFIVLEAIIIEIDGIDASREIDPATGMALLRL